MPVPVPLFVVGAAALALFALSSDKQQPAAAAPPVVPPAKPPVTPPAVVVAPIKVPVIQLPPLPNLKLPPLPAAGGVGTTKSPLLSPSLAKRVADDATLPSLSSPSPAVVSAVLSDTSFPAKLERVQKGDVIFLHGMEVNPQGIPGNWHLAYAYDTKLQHGTFVYVPLATSAPLLAFAGNVTGPFGSAETTGMWYLLQDLTTATPSAIPLAARGSGIRSELSANGVDLEAFLPGFETLAAGGVAVHHDDLLPIVYPATPAAP